MRKEFRKFRQKSGIGLVEIEADHAGREAACPPLSLAESPSNQKDRDVRKKSAESRNLFRGIFSGPALEEKNQPHSFAALFFGFGERYVRAALGPISAPQRGQACGEFVKFGPIGRADQEKTVVVHSGLVNLEKLRKMRCKSDST